LVPFIPFLVANEMFFPFITLKGFTFRILIEILFALFIILAVIDTRYRPRKSYIFIALAIFLGIITLADIFGVNPGNSFWSNFERMEGLVTLVHLFAYFIVITSVFITEKLWTRFLQTSVGASVMMSFYVFAQLSGSLVINQGGNRVDGTFGNATYLAVYALFHIFIAWLLLLKKESTAWMRWLYGGTIILNLIVLYKTETRGDILGLIGGVFLVAILIVLFERRPEMKRIRKISAGVILSLIILVGTFIVVKDSSFVRDSQTLSRFANISLTERTTKSRFQIWGLALEGFKERPILGWGQENFNIIFGNYYDVRLYDQEPFFDRAHNVFLDWLTAGGILGLLAYLFIFLTALYYIWRRQNNNFSTMEKSVLTGLLGAYFFQNLFVFDNLMSYILFFSILGYIHSYSLPNKESNGKEINKYSQYTIISITVILIVVSMYAFNVKGILANKALLQAISPQKEGFQANMDYFKKALSYDTVGKAETREQLLKIASRAKTTKGVSEKFKQEVFEFGRLEMSKQIEKTPNNIRYEIIFGSFLSQFGQFDEAIKHLKRAIELSPNKQETYFGLVSIYINAKQYDKALETAKIAYELDKNNVKALDVYALSALYDRKIKLGQKLIIEQYGTMIVNDNRYINAYANLGANDLVVQIWLKRIADLQAEGKDSPQLHVSLAASYLATGERAKAVAELKKAIELDSAFKDQGQYYIDEIQAGRNP